MRGQQIGRRAFLRAGSLFLAGATCGLSGRPLLAANDPPTSPRLKIGLLTDLHYADKETRGTRYYRDTLPKLAEAIQHFETAQVSFVMELGDLIDSAPDLETELGYLKTVDQKFKDSRLERHYVLGNHCVERLTKAEFLTEVGQAGSFESFDRGGFHFVSLDACYRFDGVPYGRNNSSWKEALIPQEELDWLQTDLDRTDKPVIVFTHQRLDVDNYYAPKNAADVRKMLEKSEKVRAVFQGHSHKNDYKDLNGIHYCTLAAMIEQSYPDGNSYSQLNVLEDGTLQLTGFRTQSSYEWKPPAKGAASKS